MRYIALATDYDGTLASMGRVNEATIRALERVKASGRKLLLVTGRHLDDLQNVFAKCELFDRIVAENGAVDYDPKSHEEKVLAERPGDDFLAALRARGVQFDVGRVIISSWVPHEKAILEVIRSLALEYQVIFNKGAVMVLPPGVNKATGLRHALTDLQLSFHNTVAIGDAENDHALLSLCECGVAVANALPSLKQRADIVTSGDHGNGVIELIGHLLKDDLQSYDAGLKRSAISIGEAEQPEEARIVPNRHSVLVAGASASGKSTAVAGILEELAAKEYQFCLIDPEGDFENFGGALCLGSPTERPDAGIITKALESTRSVIVNLMGYALKERPSAFTTLLPAILETRARTARPHWLVIDEAHHLTPVSWSPSSSAIPQELGGAIFITVHPERLSVAALSLIDVVIATGQSAFESLKAFADAMQLSHPAELSSSPTTGEALIWFVRTQKPPVLMKTHMARAERRRHRRNYAQGELSPEQSFYFRGPDGKLNLRAQNLIAFLQLAEGVDDETWMFHLRRGDYSRWFATIIKDDDLATDAKSIEQEADHDPERSRMEFKRAIESRYTAPA